MRYDHVVFDLDGTLVDSLADLAVAANHVRETFGLPALPPAIIGGYVGEGARMLVQRTLGAAHEARLEAGLHVFMEYYGAHLLDHTRPHPGIVEVLSALTNKGAKLSVLTNKPAALSRAILDGLGLSHYFVAVLGGDSLPARKPDPAGIHHLRALTRTAPDRLLIVGDSPIDLRTANAAGVAFCGVAWGLMPEALRVAAPERMIERPRELLAVVEGG